MNNLIWRPPDHWTRITTIDMHTGGEPLRVVVAGLPPIEGRTVLEKRRYFREHYDHLRTWNERITIESIIGSTISVKVAGTTNFGPYDAIIPEVSGTASITGRHEFYFDPDDPFRTGFIFR